MKNVHFALVLLLGCSASHVPPDAAPSSDDASADALDTAPLELVWTPTRSAIACTEHTATALPSGDVLLVGRCSLDGAPASALRYDALRRAATALSPLEARDAHAAVALPDGDVLLIGGFAAVDDALSTTEVFDEATNTFRAGPTLSEGRAWLGAVAWGPRVVIAGGRARRDDPFSLRTSVEAIDPSDDTVSRLPPLATARERMLLRARGDSLLAIGGVGDESPTTLEHVGRGSIEVLPTHCSHPGAAPGELDVVCGNAVLDLTAGVRVDAMLTAAHMQPAAARLFDGALLVLGSSPWTHAPPASPERVIDGTATLSRSPERTYLWPTATTLADGSVLVVGEEGSEVGRYE